MWPEMPGGQGTAVLHISHSHSFSPSLPAGSFSSAWWKNTMVKVEENGSKVRVAVCKTIADEKKLQQKYREKLWGRWWLMVPLSRGVAQIVTNVTEAVRW